MSTHACIRCSATMPTCQHDFRRYRDDVHWCCKCGALRVPERRDPFLPMSYVWCPECSDLPNFVSSEAGNPLIEPLLEVTRPQADPDDEWVVRAAAARARGEPAPAFFVRNASGSPITGTYAHFGVLRTCNVCAHRADRGAGPEKNLCPLLGCPGELQDA